MAKITKSTTEKAEPVNKKTTVKEVVAVSDATPPQPVQLKNEIGRASCRERV